MGYNPRQTPRNNIKRSLRAGQLLVSQSKRKQQPHNYLLRGKTVCSTCGHAVIYGNTTTQPMYRCMKTHADASAAFHKLKVSTADVEEADMAIIKKKAEIVLNTADLSGFRKATNNNRLGGSVVQLNNVDIEKQIGLLSKQRQ